MRLIISRISEISGVMMHACTLQEFHTCV